MSSRTKKNHSEKPEPMMGQCSMCSTPIAFGDWKKLDVATGWTWHSGAESHLQPICGRCHASVQRKAQKADAN